MALIEWEGLDMNARDVHLRLHTFGSHLKNMVSWPSLQQLSLLFKTLCFVLVWRKESAVGMLSLLGNRCLASFSMFAIYRSELDTFRALEVPAGPLTNKIRNN